jgi:hypothetical protein
MVGRALEIIEHQVLTSEELVLDEDFDISTPIL